MERLTKYQLKPIYAIQFNFCSEKDYIDDHKWDYEDEKDIPPFDLLKENPLMEQYEIYLSHKDKIFGQIFSIRQKPKKGGSSGSFLFESGDYILFHDPTDKYPFKVMKEEDFQNIYEMDYEDVY